MLFRKYESQKLYKNFKTAFVLGIVSLVFAVLTCISKVNSTIFLITTKSNVYIFNLIYDLIISLLLCLETQISYIVFMRKAYTQKTYLQIDQKEGYPKFLSKYQEGAKYNDLTIINLLIWMPLVTWLLVAFLSGDGFAYGLGYWLFSYIFLFIGNIFLAKNTKIIKNEWQYNPPQWLKEKRERQLKKDEENEKQKQDEKCNNLLKTCGMKFFIKYCEQITQLPIRDVTITENYTQIEKWQRLYAAQKIINGNLTKLALTKIIETYGNALNEEEIGKANELLEKYGKN